MIRAPQLCLAFYGDDFTGSTDALEQLTRAGIRTVLFIEPPAPKQLARFKSLQAVGVAGRTRSLPPAALEQELRPALKKLKALGAPHMHYKVCSTFDSSPKIGSIGRVIDVAAKLFPAPFIPLFVAAPALGRYCAFGNLFARMGIGSDGEIHRLDRHPSISTHPITPMQEADLRRHLARQTKKRIGLFDILKVALPSAEARRELDRIVAGGSEIVLFDAIYPEQLERIGELLDAGANRKRPLFSVGSSGIEMALAAWWNRRSVKRPRGPGTERAAPLALPLLVASGSCSPVTAAQIARALAAGFAEVPLDTAAIAAGKNAARAVADAAGAVGKHLRAGRSVVLHTSKGNSDARMAATARIFVRRGLGALAAKTLGAKLFGAALGEVVRRAVAEADVGRLCVAGGDTSSYAARALGIEALEMIAPLTPGAPLCRAHAPGSPVDGLEVVFKGGQVGGADYLTQIL